MRFIPAVSGVQIPPLLPEYNGSPGSSRASSFCGRARHAWAPAAAAAAKRAAWRKGQKPPGRSKSAGRPERACQGWWRQSLPVVALGPRPGAGKASRGCGRAAGGKKVLAKRQCPFCRWMRAPRSRPHKIGQGSSVGQSMRSIPAVSGGTLPCYQRIKKPGLWKSWAFLFCCTASRVCSLAGHAQPESAHRQGICSRTEK